MRSAARAAALTAFLVTLLCGCGGGSHSSSNAVVTRAQTQPRTTTQARTQARTTTRTTTASGHGQGSRSHHSSSHKTHHKAAAKQPRPLARLAAACRAAPRLGTGATGKKRKQSTHAEAIRLQIRIRRITSALGPPSADAGAAPILTPFRRALTHARKAIRRASVSPRPRAAQAMQRAVAAESAAAQQIGLPECALGSG